MPGLRRDDQVRDALRHRFQDEVGQLTDVAVHRIGEPDTGRVAGEVRDDRPRVRLLHFGREVTLRHPGGAESERVGQLHLLSWLGVEGADASGWLSSGEGEGFDFDRLEACETSLCEHLLAQLHGASGPVAMLAAVAAGAPAGRVADFGGPEILDARAPPLLRFLT